MIWVCHHGSRGIMWVTWPGLLQVGLTREKISPFFLPLFFYFLFSFKKNLKKWIRICQPPGSQVWGWPNPGLMDQVNPNKSPSFFFLLFFFDEIIQIRAGGEPHTQIWQSNFFFIFIKNSNLRSDLKYLGFIPSSESSRAWLVRIRQRSKIFRSDPPRVGSRWGGWVRSWPNCHA